MLPEALTAIEEGRRQMAEWAEEAERRQAEKDGQQKAKLAEAWAPIIERIRKHVPVWAHSFISQSDSEPKYVRYDDRSTWLYRPIEIMIPEIGLIYAYGHDGNRVGFKPAKWNVVNTDTDDGYIVAPSGGRSITQWEDPGTTFEAALAVAYRNYMAVPALEDEARRKNEAHAAQLAAPSVAPEPWTAQQWVEKAVDRWSKDDLQNAIGAALIALAMRQ